MDGARSGDYGAAQRRRLSEKFLHNSSITLLGRGRPHHFIFQTDGAGDISEGHVPCTLRLLGTAPRSMTSRTHEVPTCEFVIN